MKINLQRKTAWTTVKKLIVACRFENVGENKSMKEIVKSLILGASIVLAVTIYVFGTRYHAVSNQRGFEIYDQITGKEKAFIPQASPERF
jgi:hypothetical protein